MYVKIRSDLKKKETLQTNNNNINANQFIKISLCKNMSIKN